jgi:hypothetical protein
VADSIVLTDPAAERLFDFEKGRAVGSLLIEAIHDHEVNEILRSCLKTSQQQSVQLESGKRFLRAVAVPIQGVQGYGRVKRSFRTDAEEFYQVEELPAEGIGSGQAPQERRYCPICPDPTR